MTLKVEMEDEGEGGGDVEGGGTGGGVDEGGTLRLLVRLLSSELPLASLSPPSIHTSVSCS